MNLELFSVYFLCKQATGWQLEEAIQLFYAGDDTGGGGIQANAPAEVAWKEPAESSELGPRSDLSSLLSFIYAHFFPLFF